MASFIFSMLIILSVFNFQRLSATGNWSGAVESVVKLLKNLDTTFLKNETKSMNASQMITHYGYPVEEHITTTKDHYVLRLFRIPGNPKKGPVMMFIHGLVNSADNWLGLGPNSLPFRFAKLGYDVWLGNTRGNKYSRKNTIYTPENPLFWRFSWHEMGIHDVPCMIDYVLEKANVSKLTYIGHSQGTTAAYVTLSEKPEYNDKLHMLCSLASVSWMSNAKSLLFQIATLIWSKLQLLIEALNWYEVVPSSPPFSTVTELCGSSPISSIVCLTFLFYPLFGYDYNEIDFEYSGSQITHAFAGSSWYQIIHYAQNGASGGFNKFDYGAAKNLIKYGSTTPSAYPVQLITAKMVIFHSKNDWLANFTDVQTFAAKLPSKPELYQVPYDQFNHMDYMWAREAVQLVYEKVQEFVDKYQ